MLIPVCFGILLHWTPPLESTRLVVLTTAGVNAGDMGFFISNKMSQLTSWQTPFYIYGVLGIAWWFLWRAFVFEKPAVHPKISLKERVYIENAIHASPSTLNFTAQWKSIFSTRPVWAILALSFGIQWISRLLKNYPKFIHELFQDRSPMNLGYLNLLFAVFELLFGGRATDYLRKKFSTTTLRKLSICSGLFLIAASIITLGYTKSATTAIILLILAFVSLQFILCDFYANHLDVAPQYASILLGISITFGKIASNICSFIVTPNTKDEPEERWKKLFLITGCVQFVCSVLYAIFASGEKQNWANASPNETASASEQQQQTAMIQAANALSNV